MKIVEFSPVTSNLAGCYQDQQHFSEAERLYQRLLEGRAQDNPRLLATGEQSVGKHESWKLLPMLGRPLQS